MCDVVRVWEPCGSRVGLVCGQCSSGEKFPPCTLTKKNSLQYFHSSSKNEDFEAEKARRPRLRIFLSLILIANAAVHARKEV